MTESDSQTVLSKEADQRKAPSNASRPFPGASLSELLAFAASTILLGLLFFKPLLETLKICWEKEDYSHGLLLPFISAYLVHQTLEKQKSAISSSVTSEVPTYSFFGFLLLGIGLVLHLLGEASSLVFFSWAGFFPALIGFLFLAFGSTPVLPFVGAILLNFMAKPLPDALVPKLFFPLQVFAAKVGAQTLDLLQVPVYLKGNVIEIPGMQLMVEEACSGLRSLMALMTVAVIVLLTVEIPRWAKALTLVLAVAIAITLNVVRVTATGVLAYFFDPRAATGFFHTFSGMVVFLIGLVILYSVGGFIERKTQKKGRL